MGFGLFSVQVWRCWLACVASSCSCKKLPSSTSVFKMWLVNHPPRKATRGRSHMSTSIGQSRNLPTSLRKVSPPPKAKSEAMRPLPTWIISADAGIRHRELIRHKRDFEILSEVVAETNQDAVVALRTDIRVDHMEFDKAPFWFELAEAHVLVSPTHHFVLRCDGAHKNV